MHGILIPGYLIFSRHYIPNSSCGVHKSKRFLYFVVTSVMQCKGGKLKGMPFSLHQLKCKSSDLMLYSFYL